MTFNKTKSILLVWIGFTLWISIDAFFWIYYQPEIYKFILQFTSTSILSGCIITALLVLIQWRALKVYPTNRILFATIIFVTTLFLAIILETLNNLTYNYWVTGIIHVQLNNITGGTYRNFILLFVLVGLFYFSYYFNLTAQQKEQIAQTKALADEAQLLMLRYQVNPHFLFNSLNIIQAMIEKDKDRAKEMIADLSDFFRYTLSKNDQMLVPLQEEIDAVKKYLAIQKERFAGGLEIEYEIEEASLKLMLPFFIIHPLVENAIKYGFSADNDVLRLLIKVICKDKTLSILVKNSGRLAPSEQITKNKLASTKTGIENIKKRLTLFYPDCSTLELSEKDHSVCALITITHSSMSL